MEPPVISEHLSLVDYTLLVYFNFALVFYMSTFEVLHESYVKATLATFKGAIIGGVCFIITLLLGLMMRYAIKYQYSMHVGTGVWNYIYHITNISIMVIGTGFWIFSTLKAYDEICSNHYAIWGLSLGVADGAGFTLTIMCQLFFWLLANCLAGEVEQFVLPEDSGQTVSTQQQTVNHYDQDADRNRDRQDQQQVVQGGEHAAKTHRHSSARQQAPTVSPSALLMPTAGASTVTGMSPWQQQQQGQQGPMQPMGMPQAYSPYPVYMQGGPTSPGAGGYKPAGYTGNPYDTAGQHYHQQQTQQQQAQQLPTLHHTVQGPTSPANYHQQMGATTPTGTTTNSGRTKRTKKTGSNESTGSTYYQQLMKNKGGVKSISQYGELMKQKKNKR
jgi:hypothetical protein